jgi:hypothetical protein
MDRTRLVGRRDQHARGVGDVGLSEQQERVDALVVHRIDETRSPLGAHAPDVERTVEGEGRAQRASFKS